MTQQQNTSPVVPWIVWGAIFASQGLYVAIPLFLTVQPQETAPPETISTLLYAFSAVSVVILLAIPLLRRKMFFSRLKSFESEKALLSNFLRVHILSVALAEAVALYGFVLAFLTQDQSYQWPFAGVAALAMLALFPNFKKISMLWERERSDGSW